MDNNWLQVNVALHRGDGQALRSARAVFTQLAPLLDGWRRDRVLNRFYFMRKPPDIRLRFHGPSPELDLLPALRAMLDRLIAEGVVERFFTTVYEPEIRLFGGPEAMSLVHDHFDADTSAWMNLDRFWAAGTAALSIDDFTIAVANELFTLTLGDSAEVWDVWSNVLTIVGPATEPTGPQPRPALFPDDLRTEATSPEREVLQRYHAANTALSNGIIRIWERGQLTCGLRGMLPFIAVFDFHRYGLNGNRQAELAHAMCRAWNPRRGFRGVEN